MEASCFLKQGRYWYYSLRWRIRKELQVVRSLQLLGYILNEHFKELETQTRMSENERDLGKHLK